MLTFELQNKVIKNEAVLTLELKFYEIKLLKMKKYNIKAYDYFKTLCEAQLKSKNRIESERIR